MDIASLSLWVLFFRPVAVFSLPCHRRLFLDTMQGWRGDDGGTQHASFPPAIIHAIVHVD